MPPVRRIFARTTRGQQPPIKGGRYGYGDIDSGNQFVRFTHDGWRTQAGRADEIPGGGAPAVGHMPAPGEDEQEAARVCYAATTRATQRLVMGLGGDGLWTQDRTMTSESRHLTCRNTPCAPLQVARFQNDAAVTIATVNARLPSTVAADDAAHFTQLVLQEFAALHPGNAVRFGIRPLAFAAWKEKHGGT